ncbi:hypothetical protein E3E31_02610 [Thermococcus sp. M39]|uniref:hypothetical protein n=1 Tax=unclassified Thermococcus TaxID=2627626 RepID=UPI00143C0BE5|nr:MULTISPECIES: hypothetical protein [unclassified Thermococcus]NJE07435.1 hypothetical protein [Thermococcus sp. M39]NJE12433.1 hypothetical protein [Thermococcus sp. LS2]
MEPFQIHAVIQILALMSFLTGIHYAKNHNLKMHHTFIYTAVILLTISIGYMLYIIRTLSPHGVLGLFVYFYILLTIFSGRAFLTRKITRDQHKRLAMIAVLLLTLQILLAVYNFLL